MAKTKRGYQNQPYFFCHKATFGHVVSKTDPYTGASLATFAPDFKVHYAITKRTITQKYLALKTNYEDTVIIAIRHNRAINDKMTVRTSQADYSIVDVSPDADDYNSYDLITIKKISRIGG